MKRYLIIMCIISLGVMALGLICAVATYVPIKKTTTKRIYGGTFKRPLLYKPENLDPVYFDDTMAIAVAQQVYEGLIGFSDETYLIKPELAHAWQVSDDRKVWTFYLKKGVYFHNGRELEASDVKYSFSRFLDPNVASSHRWYFEKIKGASAFTQGLVDEVSGFKVLDKYTFQMELSELFEPLLSTLTSPNLKIIPKEEVSRLRTFPIGTGPFKFMNQNDDGSIKLIRNENYHEKKHPYLKKLVFEFTKYNSDTTQNYLSGKFDFLPIFDKKTEHFLKQNGKSIYSSDQYIVYYLSFNTKKYPTRDLHLRKFIQNHMNKSELTDFVYDGLHMPANTYLPVGLIGSSPPKRKDRKAQPAEPDVNWPKFTCAIPRGFYNDIKLKQHFENFFLSLGLNVEVKIVDYMKYYYHDILTQKFDMFVSYFVGAYADPYAYYAPTFLSESTVNLSNYSSKKMDALIGKLSISVGQRAKKDVIEDIEALISEDVPLIPLFHEKLRSSWASEIHDLVISPLGDKFVNYKKVWKK